MHIRQTTTRSRTENTSYTTFRLVQSVRIDGKVRQKTLLNLGRHFAIPREQWPELVQWAEGHLFISVLAYQAVQLIRTKLREAGIRDSWNSFTDH